jgi:hypothetical protein
MATSRIQFDMDDAFVEDIAKKMERTGISSRKQYFEYSLALFDWALRQSESGKLITALDEKKNSYKEISMPPLDRVRVNSEKLFTSS